MARRKAPVIPDELLDQLLAPAVIRKLPSARMASSTS